eukprot:jgi/Mesvir1/18574/Mv17083-RA.1
MDANAGKSRRMRGGEDAWTDLLEGEGLIGNIAGNLSTPDAVSLARAGGRGVSEAVGKVLEKRYKKAKEDLVWGTTQEDLEERATRKRDKYDAQEEAHTELQLAYEKALRDYRDGNRAVVKMVREKLPHVKRKDMHFLPFDRRHWVRPMAKGRWKLSTADAMAEAADLIAERAAEEGSGVPVRKELRERRDVASRELGAVRRMAGKEKGLWTPASGRDPVWDDVARIPGFQERIAANLAFNAEGDLNPWEQFSRVNRATNLAANRAMQVVKHEESRSLLKNKRRAVPPLEVLEEELQAKAERLGYDLDNTPADKRDKRYLAKDQELQDYNDRLDDVRKKLNKYTDEYRDKTKKRHRALVKSATERVRLAKQT